MRSYQAVKRRVEQLEAQVGPQPRQAPRVFTVDLLTPEGRLPADERERRVQEARAQAGPDDLVLVIDCLTCGEPE